jgi:hypothetical protein
MAKPGDALNDGGGQNRQHQGDQQRQLVLADDVVDQVFGRMGSTRPLTRLITISTKPSASTLRRGRSHLADVRPQLAEALGRSFLGSLLRNHCCLNYCMGCTARPVDASY